MKEIDLALWRSAETIANDKREFMNDGEWELLSIPSFYQRLHQDDTNYAHIQFNVCGYLGHEWSHAHTQKWNEMYLTVTSMEGARELMRSDEAADSGESRADSEADTQGCESHNETVFTLSDQWAGC